MLEGSNAIRHCGDDVQHEYFLHNGSMHLCAGMNDIIDTHHVNCAQPDVEARSLASNAAAATSAAWPHVPTAAQNGTKPMKQPPHTVCHSQ